MPTKQRTQEISSLFEKYLKNNDKSLINDLSIDELEDADTDLGWKDKDSSSRLAMQKRIEQLKQAKQNKEEEVKDSLNELREDKKYKKNVKSHFQNLMVQILSIAIVIIIALLGWFYFK